MYWFLSIQPLLNCSTTDTNLYDIVKTRTLAQLRPVPSIYCAQKNMLHRKKKHVAKKKTHPLIIWTQSALMDDDNLFPRSRHQSLLMLILRYLLSASTGYLNIVGHLYKMWANFDTVLYLRSCIVHINFYRCSCVFFISTSAKVL